MSVPPTPGFSICVVVCLAPADSAPPLPSTFLAPDSIFSYHSYTLILSHIHSFLSQGTQLGLKQGRMDGGLDSLSVQWEGPHGQIGCLAGE